MKKIVPSLLLFSLLFFISAMANGQTNKKQSDRDGDGVPDKEDHCPDKPGRNDKYVHGCPDRDGDLVIDEDDHCPDVSGLGMYHGCPDDPDAKPYTAPELPKVPAPVIVKDTVAWTTRVDKLRNQFYLDWDNAITDNEKIKAVRRFGDEVRNAAGIQTGSGLDYAIKPVMIKLATGHPDLGRLIAEAWNNQTGGGYYWTISMLPAIDQAAIKQTDSLESAAKTKPVPLVVTQPAKIVKPDDRPLDPCTKEIQALTYKRGNWIIGDNRTAIVFDYSCDKHVYTIAWMDKTGKLRFQENVMPGEMLSKYRFASGTEAWKFLVCNECDGRGFYWAHDRGSTYIGTLRIESDTKDIIQKKCIRCNGNGCTKVN